ncbi:hypothetical protein [Duncaniella dubosii]|uniref:hypothetical protein n=1 Tax=Duncaniella dubosii TaxID=2518971 RepID=UPI000F51A677|nr:hypothetical protein [Duncaniella dubosii]MCX4285419.1 hypothetical protein [Duncaniella dubosii]ROS83769.1 hypothetical protein EEK90_07110 [Muribaculaceae bacterium Isolate-036 (Harlan)]
MKILLNWRYYVLFALFSLGFLALMVVFGDPAENMSLLREEMIRLAAAAVSFVSFYILHLCVKYWESRDLIPEFTRAGEELEDDSWE